MKKLILIIMIGVFMASTAVASLHTLMKVPAEQTYDGLSDEIKARITAIGGEITGDITPNTREFENYKLIGFITTNPAINIAAIEAFIAEFSLDWEIMAANFGFKDVTSEVEVETEVNGEIITEIIEETVSVPNTLVYYDPAIIINYMKRERIYAEDETYTEVEPTEIVFWYFWGWPEFEAQQ